MRHGAQQTPSRTARAGRRGRASAAGAARARTAPAARAARPRTALSAAPGPPGSAARPPRTPAARTSPRALRAATTPGVMQPPRLPPKLIVSAPAKARGAATKVGVEPGPRATLARQRAAPLQAVSLRGTGPPEAPSQQGSRRTARGGRRVLRQQQAPGQARDRMVSVLRQRRALQLGAERLALRQHACARGSADRLLRYMASAAPDRRAGAGAHPGPGRRRLRPPQACRRACPAAARAAGPAAPRSHGAAPPCRPPPCLPREAAAQHDQTPMEQLAGSRV